MYREVQNNHKKHADAMLSAKKQKQHKEATLDGIGTFLLSADST